MAGLASGDRTDGVIAGQQELIGPQVGALEHERTLAARDRALSDADQTSADADQASADSDQAAADRDQAASDRDFASGGSRGAHESSRDARERSSGQRADSARRRIQSTRARMDAAESRDAIAEDRDVAALVRDIAADARDHAMAQRDALSQHDDDARLSKSDRMIRAAAAPKRAAERRLQAAEHRLLAAEDRRDGERDREQTARERRRSLTDREALLLELQHEQELRHEALERQHRAETLARTLQRSLSPPRLPDVDGLDLAVHHEPVAAEAVGGDFYDLFQLATGRLGFFFGDVCGKGPEAAAVTSLARYTMRTAAMLHEQPTAILMDLNAALLMDGDEPMETCTAVYGEIDIRCESAAVVLAVAGHPAPLIVRSQGDVEAITARGTMLGVIEDPAFGTCAVSLDPGDTLVTYSDGILDTTIDGIRSDEARIAELVASGEPQASARALVDRLLHALRRSGGASHDDVAIMALRRTRPA